VKVCILAGMPGAGKEEFVKVALEDGYEVIRMGDVVRMEASIRGISSDDKGVGGFAHSERQIHGYDIWARRTAPLISKDPTIIDGCRGMAELEVFRREFGEQVVVIGLHASPRTRFRRLQERNRRDAPETWDDFQERDKRELGWGLGKVIVLADHMIVNEDDIETFKKNVKGVLSKLISDEVQGSGHL
jgi:dephospho-CoA kinase